MEEKLLIKVDNMELELVLWDSKTQTVYRPNDLMDFLRKIISHADMEDYFENVKEDKLN